MDKFYSNINGRLLHIVIRAEDIEEGRLDVVDPHQYLQVALLGMDKGKTFKPHKHIYKKALSTFPQESWIVLKGSVKCKFYDINDELSWEPVIREGELSISLGGGHTYEILEDGTKVVEMKVGPYEGIENDKIMIDAGNN